MFDVLLGRSILGNSKIVGALGFVMAMFMVAPASYAESDGASGKSCPFWLDHTVTQLHSDKKIALCDVVSDKPVLVVNTASYCGFTKQFGGLEALHKKYQDSGLVVIGFPSNSFDQEDADSEKTAGICYENFGVTFLMSEAVEVRGKGSHPVFKHLAEQTEAPSWNFNKYLVDSQGEVVGHYNSRTKPQSKELVTAIEALL